MAWRCLQDLRVGMGKEGTERKQILRRLGFSLRASALLSAIFRCSGPFSKQAHHFGRFHMKKCTFLFLLKWCFLKRKDNFHLSFSHSQGHGIIVYIPASEQSTGRRTEGGSGARAAGVCFSLFLSRLRG